MLNSVSTRINLNSPNIKLLDAICGANLSKLKLWVALFNLIWLGNEYIKQGFFFSVKRTNENLVLEKVY